MTEPEATTATQNQPTTSANYRKIMLGLLTLVMIFNLLDRQIIFILAENIKLDLGLTDTQLGLLGGVTFSLIYALAALPLARLADRASKKKVLAGCIALWSLMTAIGGLAQNFIQLALTRCGVALGEAGANPASQAMISEVFPPRERVRALAILQTGVPLGIMLGLAGGGWMAEHYHWRTVLITVAVPSMLMAPLCLWLLRDAAVDSSPGGQRQGGFLAGIKELLAIPGFLWTLTGVAVFSFSAFSSVVFGAVFLIRLHDFSVGEAGLAFGLITGIAGFVATLAWGYIAELAGRGHYRRPLRITAGACALAAPLYILAWTIGSTAVMLAAFTLAWIMTAAYLPISNATIQNMAPPKLRALAASLVVLSMSAVGNVTGATLSGVLSDSLQQVHGADGLRIALSIVAAFGLVAALCYWRAAAKMPPPVEH